MFTGRSVSSRKGCAGRAAGWAVFIVRISRSAPRSRHCSRDDLKNQNKANRWCTLSAGGGGIETGKPAGTAGMGTARLCIHYRMNSPFTAYSGKSHADSGSCAKTHAAPAKAILVFVWAAIKPCLTNRHLSWIKTFPIGGLYELHLIKCSTPQSTRDLRSAALHSIGRALLLYWIVCTDE
jgi:hypothetical protein